MKSYIKNILPGAALMLTLGLGSCSLDVTPEDPSSNLIPNAPELYSKCYANMALAGQGGANGDCDVDGLDGGTTGFVRQLFNANELTTDEAICAWGDPGIPQFNYNTWDASHPMLAGFYFRLYSGVSYCNHYLESCGSYNKEMSAEVRFLRAMYYYHLMDCYGNVPFSTSILGEAPSQIKRADLFAWIESELKDCINDMQTPVARTSKDTGYGRADQDAANLLLARMYLNAEVYTGTARWEDAKTYAEKVINGPHKLNTTGKNGWSAYQMLFMGDNGENGASVEAILPLLQDGKTTTSWGTSLFLMASTWKSDMDKNNDYNTTEYWAGNRARKAFINKFFPNGDAPQTDLAGMPVAAGDDRALFFGEGRDLHVSTPTEFTSGYSVGKFRNTYTDGSTGHSAKYVDTDYFLMRSAEAYLIAAEADARLNNGMASQTGVSYINKLRARANAEQKSIYNTDDILDERARELYYEGFRRTDLIRYGYYGGEKSSEYVWEWKGGVENGTAIPAYRNLFAIPQDDINVNSGLKQNTGY